MEQLLETMICIVTSQDTRTAAVILLMTRDSTYTPYSLSHLLNLQWNVNKPSVVLLKSNGRLCHGDALSSNVRKARFWRRGARRIVLAGVVDDAEDGTCNAHTTSCDWK